MAVGRWVRLETDVPPVWKGDPETDHWCAYCVLNGFQGFFRAEGAFFVDEN